MKRERTKIIAKRIRGIIEEDRTNEQKDKTKIEVKFLVLKKMYNMGKKQVREKK